MVSMQAGTMLDPTAYDPENTKEFYAGIYWYNFYTWFDLIKLPSRSDRLLEIFP